MEQGRDAYISTLVSSRIRQPAESKRIEEKH
jgi:hypothetical protein